MEGPNKPIFLKSVILVSVLLVVEAMTFSFFSPQGITGFSIVNLSELYARYYPTSKTFLLVQWGIIAIILIVVYVRNMGIHKKNEVVKSIDIDSAMKKSKTKLDGFFLVLQEKKRLDIKTIAHVFGISPDLAMEWSRILEASNLVVIDYPAFGSPIVNVVEKIVPDVPVKKDEKKMGKKVDGGFVPSVESPGKKK